MQLSSLLGHASELVRIVRKSPQPPDALAADFLRARKYIGSTERRFLSELVFHTLRTVSLADDVTQRFALPDIVHGALALALSDTMPITLTEAMTAASKTTITDLDGSMQEAIVWCSAHLNGRASAPDDMSDATWSCTQAWLLDAIGSESVDVFRSMLGPAPLCLRVNLRHTTRDRVMRELAAMDIQTEAGRWSPAAIIIRQRVNLLQHALYLNGMIEIQDEGSQLIGYACDPHPNDDVLDACAGAGGKTVHLADLQNDSGRILAADIEAARLKEIFGRTRRAGARSVVTRLVHLTRGLDVSDARRGFDVVLVDAPCSGMGTVRRLPMVKWRLTPELAKRHAAKQRKILSTYARHVADDGVLVYATCSILPAENRQVVEDFLADHPEFSEEPLAPVMARHGIAVDGLDQTSGMLQVDPYHHGTDGLFMARLRKRS